MSTRPLEIDRIAINTITLDRQAGLPAIVEAIARRGISAICPWRHQVDAVGLRQATACIRDAGLTLSGYCRGGMLVADAGHRDGARNDNLRALDEAVALGAPCLVVVVGGLPQYSRPGSTPSKDLQAARHMIVDELTELLIDARSAGIPLALEPLHPMMAADRGCINTLRQALDICDLIEPEADGSLGVAVDVYHTWWDPELEQQIARSGSRRLLSFHVCDWLVPTKHLLTDRGMMGDGIIDIRTIRGWMEGGGYRGYTEVEIFSDRWWERPVDEVLGFCIQRCLDVV
jgi:sugar phosphate isomerase/epimerase